MKTTFSATLARPLGHITISVPFLERPFKTDRSSSSQNSSSVKSIRNNGCQREATLTLKNTFYLFGSHGRTLGQMATKMRDPVSVSRTDLRLDRFCAKFQPNPFNSVRKDALQTDTRRKRHTNSNLTDTHCHGEIIINKPNAWICRVSKTFNQSWFKLSVPAMS